MPLAPSTAPPGLCMHRGLHHSCPAHLRSHPMPPSVCVGTPQLSLSILRDGKVAHPQQVQPLLVDCIPTLTCSGALCTLEHASVIHLAPRSIHRAPWAVCAHACTLPYPLCPLSRLLEPWLGPTYFLFLSLFSLYGLSFCMPELTSLISYCALS